MFSRGVLSSQGMCYLLRGCVIFSGCVLYYQGDVIFAGGVFVLMGYVIFSGSVLHSQGARYTVAASTTRMVCGNYQPRKSDEVADEFGATGRVA